MKETDSNTNINFKEILNDLKFDVKDAIKRLQTSNDRQIEQGIELRHFGETLKSLISVTTSQDLQIKALEERQNLKIDLLEVKVNLLEAEIKTAKNFIGFTKLILGGLAGFVSFIGIGGLIAFVSIFIQLK